MSIQVLETDLTSYIDGTLNIAELYAGPGLGRTLKKVLGPKCGT